MATSKRIVITPGEPAGIGPELLVMLAQQTWPHELVVCADHQLLHDRAERLALPLQLLPYQPTSQPQPQQAGSLTLLNNPLAVPSIAGQLNPKNSSYVIETLTLACGGCLNRDFAAMVTGPVHKGVINDAGIFFSGHTEFLAEHSRCSRVVMMLASQQLRVALATTHLPLSAVPAAITQDSLMETITILDQDLRTHFGIRDPRIYVCGLNPHAGEGGHLGREEIDIIIPALEQLKRDGLNLVGPLPADTLFQNKYLKNADAVLAMYHDQGLPVLKYQSFGTAINITLGLPFIRTSVDHGTALELAGKGTANPGSFQAALQLANILVSDYD